MTVEEDMRRLEELAVSRLLEPLSTDEAEEYAALEARLCDFDESAIERIVALAHLAVLPAAEPVPRTLRAAVETDADEFFGTPRTQPPPAAEAQPSRRQVWLSSTGWWAALAASIVAVVLLVHRPSEVRAPLAANDVRPPEAAVVAPIVPSQSAPAQSAPPQSAPPQSAASQSAPPQSGPPPKVDSASTDRTGADIQSERRAFLASHPHAIERAWRAGGDTTGEQVAGDVVWDEASQTGYMRFVNLRHNEPNAEQYQLWIFDGTRDQRYPVDGGVFDITSRGGEQIVRIHAKLRVQVPLIFAVTVEHPGGVVVSDRTRIAAIADVS
jgi:anti-sigma-K factor RskA